MTQMAAVASYQPRHRRNGSAGPPGPAGAPNTPRCGPEPGEAAAALATTTPGSSDTAPRAHPLPLTGWGSSPIRRRRRAWSANGKAVANTLQLFLARPSLAHLAGPSPPPRLGRPSADGGGAQACRDKIVRGECGAAGSEAPSLPWGVVPAPAVPAVTAAGLAWPRPVVPRGDGSTAPRPCLSLGVLRGLH